MPDKTYSTTEILALSGATFYRLDYRVRTGQVKTLNQGRGHERLFSEEEATKAIRLLKAGAEKLKRLQELTDD